MDGVTISSDSSAGGVTDSAAFVAATASSHDTVVADTVSSYSQHALCLLMGEHYRHYRAPRQDVANDDFGDEQPDLATRGLRFKIDVAPLSEVKSFMMAIVGPMVIIIAATAVTVLRPVYRHPPLLGISSIAFSILEAVSMSRQWINGIGLLSLSLWT